MFIYTMASNLRLQEGRRCIRNGIDYFNAGDYESAMAQFEDAHILGQQTTLMHTQSHWWMLRVGLRKHDYREAIGQIPRIIAAIVFSKVWVPKGNNGRSNVSAFRTMPIPAHLNAFIE